MITYCDGFLGLESDILEIEEMTLFVTRGAKTLDLGDRFCGQQYYRSFLYIIRRYQNYQVSIMSRIEFS